MKIKELLGLEPLSPYVKRHLYYVNANGGVLAGIICVLMCLAAVTHAIEIHVPAELRATYAPPGESWSRWGILGVGLGLWLALASVRQLHSDQPRKSFAVAIWTCFIGMVFLGAFLSIPMVHSAYDPAPYVLALCVSALFLVTRPIILMAVALAGSTFLMAMLMFTGAPMDESIVVVPMTLVIYILACCYRYKAQLGSARAQEKLEQISCIDMLTSVGNVTKLERDVAQMAPDRLGVCLVDVDDFKAINDTHGHLMGNQVLRCVALSLEDAFRGVGKCYRAGGDEFVVLAQDINTQQLAMRLRQAQNYLSIRMGQLGLGDVVTVSAGIACAFDGGVAADAPAQAGTPVQAAAASGSPAGIPVQAASPLRPYYGGGYSIGAGLGAGVGGLGAGVGSGLDDSFDALTGITGSRRRRVSTAREIARLLDPPRYAALMQLADKRLYQSKARGKACVTW